MRNSMEDRTDEELDAHGMLKTNLDMLCYTIGHNICNSDDHNELDTSMFLYNFYIPLRAYDLIYSEGVKKYFSQEF